MDDSLEELMFNYALRSEHEADLTQVVPPSQILGAQSRGDTSKLRTENFLGYVEIILFGYV